MADEKQPGGDSANAKKEAGAKASTPRKIPGNLPYLVASGTLKRALDGMIVASRPEKFNADFLENVLKLTGGSARATIPIMKKMGFISSEGTPTELYAKFRTDSSRPAAAYAGLRTGFPEIFKRSEYAHTVDDNKVRDIILEITGLKSSDQVATAIRSTFNVIKSFIPAGANLNSETDSTIQDDTPAAGETYQTDFSRSTGQGGKPVGLVYNINIVLPETSDLKILNAIF